MPSGSVAGLIGPNGAGKTTIMAMLLGLVRPSGGSATVLGSPVSKRTEYLPRVGALIEGPAFHPGVSGVDNLRSLAVLGGHSTVGIDDLIDLVGLTGRGGDRVGSYSFGMKQRLGIAAALIGDPAAGDPRRADQRPRPRRHAGRPHADPARSPTAAAPSSCRRTSSASSSTSATG